MTKITYTITTNYYSCGKACKYILYEDIKTRSIAQKHIKSARLHNKKAMLSAQKKGNTEVYDALFNTTFSITINISTESITTL